MRTTLMTWTPLRQYKRRTDRCLFSVVMSRPVMKWNTVYVYRKFPHNIYDTEYVYFISSMLNNSLTIFVKYPRLMTWRITYMVSWTNWTLNERHKCHLHIYKHAPFEKVDHLRFHFYLLFTYFTGHIMALICLPLTLMILWAMKDEINHVGHSFLFVTLQLYAILLFRSIFIWFYFIYITWFYTAKYIICLTK